jgi:hypothetical protein
VSRLNEELEALKLLEKTHSSSLQKIIDDLTKENVFIQFLISPDRL